LYGWVQKSFGHPVVNWRLHRLYLIFKREIAQIIININGDCTD